MPVSAEQFDEFGIPIKKTAQPEFDEFGIPIKKKDFGVELPAPPSVSSFVSASPEPPKAPSLDPKEINDRYARVSNSTAYLNSIIDSRKQADPKFASNVLKFIADANELNNKGLLAERTSLAYDFFSRNSDLETNDETRDAFINSIYSGSFYSESPQLKSEYEASELKDMLTPRQYSALKSLSYGRQSQYGEIERKIKDKSFDPIDLEYAKVTLDKIGAEIDQSAASLMFNQGKDKAEVERLYIDAKNNLQSAQDRERQLDYENPYTLKSFSNIMSGAIDRGLAMGGSADILNVTADVSGIDYERLARVQADMRNARASKAYEAFSENPSFENFKKNPMGIMAELSLESLVALYSHGVKQIGAGAATGALVGSVVPGVGTAMGAGSGVISGLGISSLNLEYSSTIMDELSTMGVDVTDAEQLKNAFANKDTVDKLKESGLKKGIPVALFDMISAGIAGKIAARPAKTMLGRTALAAGEVAAQAAAGAAGEAAGQIVQKGEVYSPNAVLMEAIGELGPGSVEIAYGTMVEAAKRGKPISKRDAVSVASQMKPEDVKENLSTQVASGNMTQAQAEVIGKEVAAVSSVLPKVPEELSVDAKAKVVDLIGEKNKLTQKLQSIDDALKPEIQQKIDDINNQIVQTVKTDQDATQESRQEQGVVPEGGVVQPERVEEGQREVRQGEGGVREGEVPQADVGDRAVGGERGVEEVRSEISGIETQRDAEIAAIQAEPITDQEKQQRVADATQRFEAQLEPLRAEAAAITTRELQGELAPQTAIDRVLNEAIPMASQSLRPFGTEFVVLENDEEAAKVPGIGQNQAIFKGDDNKVYINKSRLADEIEAGIVVWHEAAHPVMNTLMNTDRPAYDRAVRGFQAAAQRDPNLKNVFDWANTNYSAEAISQREGRPVSEEEAMQIRMGEGMVETVGRVNEGLIDINKLDSGFRQVLIDFINKVAEFIGMKPILKDTDLATFKRTVSKVADALKSGRDITEVVGAENVREYMNTLDSPGVFVGGEMIPSGVQASAGDRINVYESKEVVQLPQRSLQDVYDNYEGKAVVINSDPTRVGELTLPSGKKIFMYGGPGYLSVMDNVDGNVGFATTQLSKVNTWFKYVRSLFGDNPGVTLVATQAPTSVLSNSYALRYVMDAISILPKSVLRSQEFKNEFFGKDLVLLKDAFGEKQYKEFVAKYKKADLSKTEVIDEMISEMAYKVGDDSKPASFKARGAFVSNLLGGLTPKAKLKTVEGNVGYVSKKPSKYISGQLMDRLGINAEKLIRDIAEPSLVDLYMNEGKWGMVVAGFETDPNLSVESVQQGGVKHPLFNAKFPGKNPFILDGAYEVNAMFKPVDMVGPKGKPYTKKAAQMLAGSMYVKGKPQQKKGVFEYRPTAPAAGRIQASAGGRIDLNAFKDAYVRMNPHSGGALTGDAAAFDALPDDAKVFVFHATTPNNAQAIVNREVDYTPEVQDGATRGLSQSIYVASDPRVVSGMGSSIVGFLVNKGDLKVSPEAETANQTIGQAVISVGTGSILTNNPQEAFLVETQERRGQSAMSGPDAVYKVYEESKASGTNPSLVSMVESMAPTQASVGNRQQIIDQAKAAGTYLKAPNGKPTKLTEDQWTTVRTPEFKNWFGDWENDPANASKVVDENGEPMVVYHGTRESFDSFDRDRLGSRTGADSARMAFFFTDNPEVAESYPSGERDAMASDRVSAIWGGGVEGAQDALDRHEDSRSFAEYDEEEAGFIGKITEYDKFGSEYTYDADGMVYDTEQEAIDAANKELDKERIKLEGRLKAAIDEFERRKEEYQSGMNIIPSFLNIKNPYYYDFSGSYDTDKNTEIVEEAVEEGSDGVWLENADVYLGNRNLPSNVFAAFNPTQIKSATANIGAFSPTDARIQMSVGNRQMVIDKAKSDGTYLKAPNGKKTKLNEDQWVTVRTLEFKNWFGDWEKGESSKSVLDDNGEPRVFYHGSPYDFEAFQPGEPIYLTSNKSVADEYRNMGGWRQRIPGGRVYDVFVRGGDILEIDAMGTRNNNLKVPGREWKATSFGNVPEGAITLSDYVKENIEGKDGVMIRNVVDTKFTDSRFKSDVIAVAEPIQVKSASENIGAFSPTDARIQASVGNRQLIDQTALALQNSVVENNPFKGRVYRGVGERVNVTYGGRTDEGLGDFYTDNKIMAGWFAGTMEFDLDKGRYAKTGRPGKISESILEIKNPYTIDENDPDYNEDSEYDSWQIFMNRMNAKTKENVQDFVTGLISKGHDGIALKGNTTNYYASGTYDIYVKFKPDQFTDAAEAYVKAKADGTNPDLVSAVESRVGDIQASAGGRVENDTNFKLAAFVMRKKGEGASTVELVTSIASVMPGMSPQDIQSLINDPEAWLKSKFPGMTPEQQDNLIATAKRQNIYRGRKFGKPIDPAYHGLHVPDDMVEEYTKRNRRRDNAVKELFDKVFSKAYFTSSKGMPDWFLQVKDMATGAKNIEIERAAKTIEKLRKVAKSIGFSDWDTFSKALKDAYGTAPMGAPGLPMPVAAPGMPPLPMAPVTVPPSIAALPAEIIPFVYAMRGQIDNLTRDLIGFGYVTPEQAITLQRNIGAYVNRSYRMFTEKGYKPDKKAIDAAVKYFVDEKLKEIATDKAGAITLEEAQKEALDQAMKRVDDILDRKTNPYFRPSEVDRRNPGILKQRQDIPEPIRRLMGEYTDPGLVFMLTVGKQAALKASSQYLSEMRKNGMGTIFFEKDDPNRPLTHNIEVATMGSEALAPLGGLYTTQEVYDALMSMEPTYNNLTQVWMKTVGIVRWSKTVASLATQMKNFESNLGFAVMNGLLMTGSSFDAFKGSIKYVKNQYSPTEIDEITEKAIKLNLVGQAVGARELAEMLGSGDIHDVALDVALGPEGRWGRRVAKRINPVRMLNKAYRLGDDFWKVYAYMNERQLVSRGRFDGAAYESLTPEQQDQVDAESSERVKNTWPTYDRVIEAAKFVSKRAPIVGNFISFQAESLRVLANTIKLAAQDIKDPQMRESGIRRMVGITSYVSLRTAITLGVAKFFGFAASGLLGAAFGDDDEERRKGAIKYAMPTFSRTGDFLNLPKDDAPHRYTVVNLSDLDPYGIIPRAFNALTEGREGIFGKTMEPGVPAAIAELFSSFLEPEMTFNAIWSLMNNNNIQTGERIVNESDSPSEVYDKAMGYLWKQLKPSTYAIYERLRDGGSLSVEAFALFGMRPYEVDLHKSWDYALGAMGRDMDAVIKEFNRVSYDDKATPEQKQAALVEAEMKKGIIINKYHEVYKNFILTGANPDILNQKLDEKSRTRMTGFDNLTKDALKTNKISSQFFKLKQDKQEKKEGYVEEGKSMEYKEEKPAEYKPE